jgi:GNAT superfamily N-acetyltransferase
MIRGFRAEDAGAVAELLHEDEPPAPVTAAGLLHWLAVQPERAAARAWVALEGGELAGWARSRFLWKTRAERIGEAWVFVRPTHRRRGVGTALLRTAEEHLLRKRARVLQTWTSSDDDCAFLEHRAYRSSRRERISLLDLAGETPAPQVPEGYAVVALRDLRDRTRELHALDAAAGADVPETFAEDDVRYAEWTRETLEHPDLSLDGSFVVLHGQEPVSYAFLHAEPDATLAANEMTGTLPEYRGRGLARLAKLATIRWAGDHGYRTIVTTNDERNLPMLRLNESLGYRAVGTETEYVREDLS